MEIREKEKISEKTRIYRAKHRLNQSQLGAMCGLSKTSISNIEEGKWSEMSEECLRAVEAVLRRKAEGGRRKATGV